MTVAVLQAKRKFAWRKPSKTTAPGQCQGCSARARKSKLFWFKKRWLCAPCMLEA